MCEIFEHESFQGSSSVSIKRSRKEPLGLAFSNRHSTLYHLYRFLDKDRPEIYLVITFGLGYRMESADCAAVGPYPNRWTHHVLVQGMEEIDEELMGWVKEAAVFAAGK